MFEVLCARMNIEFLLQSWSLNPGPKPEALHQPFMVKGFLFQNRVKLFAQFGFKLRPF
jgi:hypothetical protein